MKSIAAVLVLMFFLALSPAVVHGEALNYKDIHPAGWLESRAVSVNDAGDVAGYGRTAAGERGFLLSAGTFVEILPPGAAEARATWINGFGDVAVTAVMEQTGLKRAFVYSGGKYLDPTPGWAFSAAAFIDDDGAVAGSGEFGGYVSRNGVTEVFPGFSEVLGSNAAGNLIGAWDNAARMYIPGTGYVDLVPPGAISAKPQGINGNSLVAISSSKSGTARGAVYNGGFFYYMAPSGWTSSVAMGINDGAQVVGYGDSPAGRRSFLFTLGVYEEVAFPGWIATEAASLNNDRKIAGSGTTAAGEVHAFVAMPSGIASDTGTTPSAATPTGGSGSGGCAVVHGEGRDASPGTKAASVLALMTPIAVLSLRRRMMKSSVFMRGPASCRRRNIAPEPSP